MLYRNVFKSVSGNVSVTFRLRIKKDGYNFLNVFLTDLKCSKAVIYTYLVWGYHYVLNTKQNVTKTCS